MLELLVIFIAPSVQEPQVPNFEDAIWQFEKAIQVAEDCSRGSLFDDIYADSSPLPQSTAHILIAETHGSLGILIATSAGGLPH